MALLDDPANDKLAAMLGMSGSRRRSIKRKSMKVASQELHAIQRYLPEKFKAAAFALHPDRNLGDPDATATFAKLAAIRDEIEAMVSIVPKTRKLVRVESIIKTPTDDELEQHGGATASRGTRISFFS